MKTADWKDYRVIATGNGEKLESWGDVYWSVTSKVYNIKMYQGGTLLRNFIPAIRDNDGIIGFYDQVEQKFYRNIGSGNFLAGKTQ